MELYGKTIVVTGVTRGLGRELAVAFTEAGCQVAGLGRDAADLRETSSHIASKSFLPIECDVGDPEAVELAIQKIIALNGSIDVLFNNAALYPRMSFLEESAEDWSSAINTNVNGVANTCKAVLPHMIKARWGRIYNLGSWAYLGPIRNSAAYSASKGAVHTLTLAIAEDLQPLGLDVQVHEWIPGHLNTRMSEFTGIDPSISASWAVAMVRSDAASKKCTIFENDYEWVPPKRIKDRLLDMVLLRFAR